MNAPAPLDATAHATLPHAATAFASGAGIAEIAALLGDPARANMLLALMGGPALTAGELARQAGVSAPTASGHLAKLAAAGVVAARPQGRHRYYRLASPEIAEVLHALMLAATLGPPRHRPPGPRDGALRLARSCYDHLAGRLAVALLAALEAQGHVRLANEGEAVEPTPQGRAFLAEFGLDLDGPGQTSGADCRQASRRPLCRTCLDWSERRPHLAGRLGAGLLERLLALGWLARVPGSRALTLTRTGEAGLIATFHLPPDWREGMEGGSK
ncbi:ArsR/SmtB family transcription factor [Ancylobacter rudongensis]|uniref:DNA-binding transcriptional regulator, ArsR family n=1 Tax=Ancylobacter rudongensis TaxID=177413 RepID=A0A1G4SP82_9HYPH|nr:helix-turn-helix transcriptional regulator [Ancylobacter rudongensis]SCW70821.1 DNA-binding transcriptional regulator, ArsR family [Ancylobacter rudongensis]